MKYSLFLFEIQTVKIPGSNVRAAQHYWSDVFHQRAFLDELAKKLNIRSHDDWYSLTGRTLRKQGGAGLLAKYGGSLTNLFKTVYPEYLVFVRYRVYNSIFQWNATRFRRVPNKHWDTVDNQRIFMDEITKRLNITYPEQWYKISHSTLRNIGAYGLIEKYNGSLPKLLQSVYPEYPSVSSLYASNLQYSWDTSKFRSHLAIGYWNNLTNQRNFMEELAKKLNITEKESWYKVTSTVLLQHGANSLLTKHNGSLRRLLKTVFPEYPGTRMRERFFIWSFRVQEIVKREKAALWMIK